MNRKIIYTQPDGAIQERFYFGGISHGYITKEILRLQAAGNMIMIVKRTRKCHKCKGEGHIWFNDKSFEEVKYD